MKLSFKIKLNNKKYSSQLKIVEELSFHTTKLYNIANYDCINNKVLSYYDMNKKYNNNWHKQFLHSHTYQHILRVLAQNWKSYFKSLAEFKKHPQKYKGMPKPPKYKNLENNKNEVIFTNLAVRFSDSLLKLSLSNEIKSMFGVDSLNFVISDKLQSLIDFNSIQQAKFKYDNSLKCWFLILNYKKKEAKVNDKFDNIMSIDLGLSNLATITTLNNSTSYIINGKPLKSVNSFVNKEIARLQSLLMLSKKTSKIKDTKEIKRLRTYRHNYILDYLHKASRRVVNLAIKNQCKTIVIGNIKNIKQNMNFNKTFVQIPLQQFVGLIQYKALLQGISVRFQNEAYSSGCSALDLDPIKKSFYNKKRRLFRGLFCSNKNICINADVNGSLNILRLYLKDECIPRLINLAKDKGFVFNPVLETIQ